MSLPRRRRRSQRNKRLQSKSFISSIEISKLHRVYHLGYVHCRIFLIIEKRISSRLFFVPCVDVVYHCIRIYKFVNYLCACEDTITSSIEVMAKSNGKCMR